MPSGILPDEGIGDQLYYILSAPIAGVVGWQLLLFVNDITPDFDAVLADLEEATWEGYSRMTLDRATWTMPDVNMGCATSTYGTEPIVYFPEGTDIQTNYGCAYVDPSKSVIRFVQRFDDADIAPIQPGGQFSLLPQYTLTSASCPGSMAAARRRTKRKAKGERRG